MKIILKAFKILINSNVYISLAAVALTLATQIQLGMNPQFHSYLFLIFFATLLVYNLHRFIVIFTDLDVLEFDNHNWLKRKLTWFYVLFFLSVSGFIISVIQVNIKVLLTFVPIAVLAFSYSIPLLKNTKVIFRLRQIPYLKIFLISFVWTIVTILIPVIHSNQTYNNFHILTMMIERFLFVFAITIPFDIRDMYADRRAGLKTLPLLMGKKKSIFFSQTALMIFFIITLIHYSIISQWNIAFGFAISTLITLVCLNYKKLQNLPLYYYGVLDGTILLQGVLIIGWYYANGIMQIMN